MFFSRSASFPLLLPLVQFFFWLLLAHTRTYTDGNSLYRVHTQTHSLARRTVQTLSSTLRRRIVGGLRRTGALRPPSLLLSLGGGGTDGRRSGGTDDGPRQFLSASLRSVAAAEGSKWMDWTRGNAPNSSTVVCLSSSEPQFLLPLLHLYEPTQSPL